VPGPASLARRISSGAGPGRAVALATVGLIAVLAFALSRPAGAHRAALAVPAADRLGPQLAPLGDPGRWRLAFDDEFDGRGLDLSAWRPNWLGTSDTATTSSADPSDDNCADPAQLAVAAGALELTTAARRCAPPGARARAYASGLVETRRTFTHGFLEARIFIPTFPTGTPVDYPGFWATGTGRWPQTGEIDVMEVLGHCGPGLGFYFTSAAGTRGGCVSLRHPGGWHVFGVDWEPGFLAVYYDGTVVGRIAGGVTAAPMSLVLDNSVNPRTGGPAAPSRVRVDYVRVWSRTGARH
jgi:beta-glucanase (GH16 family)